MMGKEVVCRPEIAEYQIRQREEGLIAGWSEWEKCSERWYQKHIDNPDPQFQVRALIVIDPALMEDVYKKIALPGPDVTAYEPHGPADSYSEQAMTKISQAIRHQALVAATDMLKAQREIPMRNFLKGWRFFKEPQPRPGGHTYIGITTPDHKQTAHAESDTVRLLVEAIVAERGNTDPDWKNSETPRY